MYNLAGSQLEEIWKSLLNYCLINPSNKLGMISVEIEEFNINNLLSSDFQQKVNEVYKNSNNETIENIAFTIFPEAYWNRNRHRAEFYKRYLDVYPRIKKKFPRNCYGMYFHRLIAFNDGQFVVNQLEEIIGAYNNGEGNHRFSALQATIYNPIEDIKHIRMRRCGFPCLQQVSFNVKDGLEVFALYPTQAIFEKALGNYLGLLQLGNFMGHEMQLKFKKLSVIIYNPILNINKSELTEILKLI